MRYSTLASGCLVLTTIAFFGSPAVGNDKTELDILKNTSLLLQQQQDLQTALTTLSKKDDDLATREQADADALAKLGTTLAEMTGAQRAFSDSISSVQSDVDKQFTGNDERLDDIKSRIGTLQDQMQKVQQTVQALQAPAPAAAAGPSPADQLFNAAMADAANPDRMVQAQSELSQFTRGYPLDPRAGEAAYWLGYVLYNEKNYADAIEQFRTFLDGFPENSHVPDAEYWQAMSYWGRKETSAAEAGLRNVIKKYPGTPQASDAQKALATIQGAGH